LTAYVLAHASLFFPRAGSAQDARGVGLPPAKPEANKETEVLSGIYRNSYALLIGNSEYQNPTWPTLSGVNQDIPAVRQALEAQNFKVEEAWNLPRIELLARLDNFISDYGQDLENRVLVYYAGHGYTALLPDGRKMGYLVMKDAPAMPPVKEALEKTPAGLAKFRLRAISMDEIEDKARAITTRHALFVFDSCFSGTALYRDNVAPAPSRITAEALEPMRGFLTAGNEYQLVLDNSPFRQAFVKGLAGAADLTGDGFILFTELGLYLQAEVAENTNHKQTPLFGKQEKFNRGDMVFVSPKAAASLPKLSRIIADNAAKFGGTAVLAPKAQPPLDILTAQSILDRALQARDGSVQGQVEALESLLARGHEFSNTDLSGISLRGAKIAKGTFKKVRMHAIDLREADARGANFAESGLRFANLEQAHFADATMTGVYAPFMWGPEVDVERADLSGANFFSANLRGANFSHAKLRGASFAFADLRGAKFDGADLTGAYLIGAVLDDATFTEAIVNNTEFTGAVAANFLLSEKQKRGACRHESDHGWTISLYESGKLNSFAYVSMGFQSFADRSLPRCTTEPLDMFYNTARDNIQYAIYVDGLSVSKADRRQLFSRRLYEHGNFLKANLTADRVLKGDNAQRKSWEGFVRNAIKNTTPVSKPYLNTDLMLVLLLRAGVLDEKLLNWTELAAAQHKYETSVREDHRADFNAYSMWSPIFPPGVSWPDLPEDKAELYKNWTLARVAKAPAQVIVKVPLSLEREQAGEPLVVSLANVAFGSKGDHYSGVKEKGIAIEQTVYAPFDFTNGLLKQVVSVLYVFPEKVAHYRMELPGKFKGAENLELEFDLQVEKFDRLQRQDSYKRDELSAFVFVTPGNFRLLKEGKLLWSGKVQKDEATIERQAWEQIKDSQTPADFKTFLAAFPHGAYAENASSRLEQMAWDGLKRSCDEAALQAFLKEFPAGANAAAARAKLKQLVKSVDAAPANLKAGSIARLPLPNGAEMCLAWIPPGSFMMGSPPTEAGRNEDEGPQRRVTISEGFWLAQFEVTQAQYEAVMKTNPAWGRKNATHPVDQVSWDTAKRFINRLNEAGGEFEYGLPTEAEWEYAARAGTTTAFAFGDKLSARQANFDGTHPYGDAERFYPKEYAYGVRPVGSYQPNAWGLYDMHGNVQEWVEDVYKSSYAGLSADGAANLAGDSEITNVRSVRGGTYLNEGVMVRSAARWRELQRRGFQLLGFRVALKRKTATPQVKPSLSNNRPAGATASQPAAALAIAPTVHNKIKDRESSPDTRALPATPPRRTNASDAGRKAEKANTPAGNARPDEAQSQTVRQEPATGNKRTNWLDGVWAGTGYQSDIKLSWPIRFTARDSAYLVEYPSLSCGGKWTLVELGASLAKFKEQLTHGAGGCMDNGDVIIERKSDAQLVFKYFLSNSNTVAASAILFKQ
jgi:formylglycine-generating enzyme required for sulfatase activity/uncharacterized protein YjbI with pentapeptide repeats